MCAVNPPVLPSFPTRRSSDLIPPTVGFYAKFLVFEAAINEGFVWLAVVGVLASLYGAFRSEEHTSELQSRRDLVCRLLLEKKKMVMKFGKKLQQIVI